MDFEKRLEQAIVRGERTRDAHGREQRAEALNAEQLRALHSRYRIELSDHIESCLKKVADRFPGFRFQTIVGEEGWGAKISRDDFRRRPGQEAATVYSRLEMAIRPASSANIVELAAKGTIQNKEVFNRTHFQFLAEADMDSFRELIDLWVLEYVEQFASRG